MQKQMEDALLQRFVDKYPNATEGRVTMGGYGYVFSPSGVTTQQVVMKADFHALHPLKKGGVKQKTVVAQVAATYCPFCGQKC